MSTWNPILPAAVFDALPQLTGSAVKVAVVLSRYANKAWVCRPAVATIAKDGGLSRRAVQVAFGELVAAQLLEIDHGGRGAKHANTYRLRAKQSAPLVAKGEAGCALKGAETDTIRAKQGAPELSMELETTPALSRSSKKRNDADSKKAEPKKPNVWGEWIDSCRAAGRSDPLAVGPDLKAAKTIGAAIPDPHERKKIMSSYLRDSDGWLAKQGHPLRLLPGRAGAYRAKPLSSAARKEYQPEVF